ncbi:MAG: hypothetical protein MUC95_09400 [Spirochaetes bacterium]|nr:hypothetical protein [Spirochaetota bacterium]
MPKKIRDKIIISNTAFILIITAFILIFFNYHIRDLHLKIIERENCKYERHCCGRFND